jgi:hypothetical protein
MVRTTKQLAKTALPVELKAAMKEEGNTKNAANVVVFHDDTRTVRFCNTQWDGGSRNAYYIWHFGRSDMASAYGHEGQEVTLGDDWALVILSHFMGQECKPTVYVKDAALARFFGVQLDEIQVAGMPSAVQADYLDDAAQSGNFPKLTAKKFAKVAAALRSINNV